jgi:hypothetical protein
MAVQTSAGRQNAQPSGQVRVEGVTVGDVTKDDLAEHGDRILDEVRRGFAGVYARQDITNGRVQKLEVETGRQDERVRAISRELFGRRAEDRRASRDDWNRAVTKRDVAIVVGTTTAVVACMKFLAWIAPAAAVIKP